MKNLLLAVVLVGSFYLIGVKPIQLEFQYDYLSIGDTIFIQGQNLSYILGNQVYLDLWNNTLVDIINSNACSNTSNIVLTSNNSAFCLKLGQKNYLNHIQPSTAQVIQQFLYTGENLGDLIAYNDYIIFTSSNQDKFAADIFDATRAQFYCNVPPIDLEASFQDVFVTGDDIIVAQGNLRTPYDSSLLFISCYENTVIKTPFNSQMTNVLAFNNTSVFLTTTWSDVYMNEFQPFYFDLTGQAQFGHAQPSILDVYKFNDTNILVSDSENINLDNYELYYINSYLTPVKTQNLTTGISAYADVITYLEKDNSLLMTDQSTTFIYNFETMNITHAWSSIPPIVLGNGTVLNFSDANGYLIQNPGEPITYVFSPYALSYYSSDFNNVWFFYNPAYGEFPGYPNCTLTQIQINTSTITKHTLKHCMCDLSEETPPIFTIFNISIDNNGLPNVVYTCSDNLLGAAISNANGTNEVPLGYGFLPIVSSNLEAGIINMGYLNYKSKEFIVQRYNATSTLPIGKEFRVPLADTTHCKIAIAPDGCFIIGSSSGNISKFHVFDVNSFSIVKNFTASLPLEYNQLPFQFISVMDYVNSTNFGGLIYSDGTNAYAISSSGNFTKVPIDFNIFVNVIPASENSFYVSGVDSSFTVNHLSYFEVTSW